jgi:beta-lactamase regulating signal transducer with metallopeptidase domain
MDSGLWIALLILVGVIIYVIGKVRFYMKQSDVQWRQVDKSKLRSWEDDD